MLAKIIASIHDEPYDVLDIGANIGDSALQILSEVNAQVLCVEADPYWLRFLALNVKDDPRVSIEHAIILPPGSETAGFDAVRIDGTSRFFTRAGKHSDAQSLTAAGLRARHPEVRRLLLVKSDTDGYDTRIIPAIAEAWSDSCPTLFFEYAPDLAAAAGDSAPDEIWPKLEALGYNFAAVWDNKGSAIGSARMIDMPHAALIFKAPPEIRGYEYWDVAACHATRHDEARATSAQLMSGRRLDATA